MTSRIRDSKPQKREPPPPVDDRTLPHSLDAEKAVLGAIMIDNAGYERVATLLSPASFYRHGHALTYQAITELLDGRHGVADALTVKDQLAKRGHLDEAGGPAYVSSLTDGVPRSTNLRFYAGIVREKALLRDIITAANKTLVSAYEAEDAPDVILAEADRAFIDLQRGSDRRGQRSGRSLYADIQWRAEHRGELSGLDTGFRDLNAETFGWQASDMIVVGARPSIGKSILAVNTATACAKAGKRPLIFSLEMRERQIEYRLLSNLSKVPCSRIMSGALGEKDMQAVGEAFLELERLNIPIHDRAGVTVQEIRSKCRLMRSESGLDLVIVDYVQLVRGSLDRRGATRTEELSDISRRLKGLADEMSVPVIVVSQLKRTDGTPMLTDLRESGGLEQDADVVILLHRKNHREGGTTKAILEKQRMGPTGTVLLHLERDLVTFTDVEEGTTAPAEEAARPSTRRKYAIAAKRRQQSEESPHLPSN